MNNSAKAGIGGFTQGFSNAFFPSLRQNEAENLRRQDQVRRQEQAESMNALRDLQTRIAQENQAHAGNRRQAMGLLNSGQLQGDLGQWGRTPEEMQTKYGANPLQYLSPSEINYRTPEQQNEDALGLYGQKRLIDLATTPKEAVKPKNQLVEMEGSQGFGNYVVDLNNPQKKVFVGRNKPKGLEHADVKSERDLRKEYTANADYFNKINQSYSTIKAISKNDSAAGDVGLVFSIMKMFDPGSVVRESEFATAENAAGVPERLRARYNKLLTGERLTPEQRQDFVGTAENIYKEHEMQFRRQREFYRGLANQYGMDPDRITYDFTGRKETNNNKVDRSAWTHQWLGNGAGIMPGKEQEAELQANELIMKARKAREAR